MIIYGDSLEYLKTLPENSVDSVVTDPPYGYLFMGKKWDYDVPTVELWAEVFRILKPGAHGLVACGTRTQHRMAVNLEDAGFEIRDIVAWVYGSGFPKSLNIGKEVDKLQGNEREVVGVEKVDIGIQSGSMHAGRTVNLVERALTKGHSPFEGQGTALKPAMELFTLVRKPISEKNITLNVLKHGTGGLDIDGSRVGTEEKLQPSTSTKMKFGGNSMLESSTMNDPNWIQNSLGRFPANFIHDGSEEVTTLLGDSQRFFYCAKPSRTEKEAGLSGFEKKQTIGGGGLTAELRVDGSYETSSPAGKFGSVKAMSTNFHPTVKPITLMEYLVNLVTPEGGTCLDPFLGSGTTGIACVNKGFNFIGIEREADYVKIAEARIEHARNNLGLFGEQKGFAV